MASEDNLTYFIIGGMATITGIAVSIMGICVEKILTGIAGCILALAGLLLLSEPYLHIGKKMGTWMRRKNENI